MTVFKLTLFELHNVNLGVKHFRLFEIAHYFVLPLVKVAGFSVGGVMVSTTGSDPVDRGSTPFLPTTFKLFICYLEK